MAIAISQKCHNGPGVAAGRVHRFEHRGRPLKQLSRSHAEPITSHRHTLAVAILAATMVPSSRAPPDTKSPTLGPTMTRLTTWPRAREHALGHWGHQHIANRARRCACPRAWTRHRRAYPELPRLLM